MQDRSLRLKEWAGRIWNGPFYVGPLVQPVALGSAILKILEVGWRGSIVLIAVATVAVGLQSSWRVIETAFPPAPSDQEECKAASSKNAKNQSMLVALFKECALKFPAVRSEDGTYVFWDPQLQDWVDVSGPTLSAADLVHIAEIRNKKKAEEADRLQAVSKLNIVKYDISCNDDSRYVSCYDKNITVKLFNGSNRTMMGLNFSYEIGKGITCSGALGKKFSQSMKIRPSEYGSFVMNFKFDDAGPAGIMTGCVKLDSVDMVG